MQYTINCPSLIITPASSWSQLQPSGIGRRAVASPRQRCVSAFSEDTFPAVPAQEPEATPTCCASLKPCLSPSAGRSHIHPPRSTAPRPRGASAASQDRAAGVVNAGSRGAPANVTPPDAVSKTAMAFCCASLPLPTLDSTCADPLARECDAETQVNRSTLTAPAWSSSATKFTKNLTPSLHQPFTNEHADCARSPRRLYSGRVHGWRTPGGGSPD